MKYRIKCEYCTMNFASLTERALHIQHSHPEQTIGNKEQTYRYFEALTKKYKR